MRGGYTLAALLTWADLYERRAAATAQSFHGRVFRQAALFPKHIGRGVVLPNGVAGRGKGRFGGVNDSHIAYLGNGG
eukprot:6890244-Prymnesium_polylepis.1